MARTTKRLERARHRAGPLDTSDDPGPLEAEAGDTALAPGHGEVA